MHKQFFAKCACSGDLVLASASGLDPHISMQGAMLQVPRIARDRGFPESEVKLLVYQTFGAGPVRNIGPGEGECTDAQPGTG